MCQKMEEKRLLTGSKGDLTTSETQLNQMLIGSSAMADELSKLNAAHSEDERRQHAAQHEPLTALGLNRGQLIERGIPSSQVEL